MSREKKAICPSVDRVKLLPTELLLMIFLMLAEKELLNCEQVCRHWLSIIKWHVWPQKLSQLALKVGLSKNLSSLVPRGAFFAIGKIYHLAEAEVEAEFCKLVKQARQARYKQSESQQFFLV